MNQIKEKRITNKCLGIILQYLGFEILDIKQHKPNYYFSNKCTYVFKDTINLNKTIAYLQNLKERINNLDYNKYNFEYPYEKYNDVNNINNISKMLLYFNIKYKYNNILDQNKIKTDTIILKSLNDIKKYINYYNTIYSGNGTILYIIHNNKIENDKITINDSYIDFI